MSRVKNKPQPWQNHLRGLYEFSATCTSSVLSRGADAQSTQRLIRKLDLVADGEIGEFLRQEAANGRQPDCREGCCHCCYQVASVTPLEAIAIFEYISTSFTTADLQRVRGASREYHAKMAGLAPDEYRAEPCPLLENDRCSVHADRPAACRGFFSYDVNACIARRETSTYSAAPLAIPPLHITDAFMAGQMSALSGKELATEYLILGSALHVLFEQDRVAERFFAGEDVFAAARMPVKVEV